MADSVATVVLTNNNREYRAVFSNLSDGTGESAVKKIDISTLVNASGVAPTAVKIWRVDFDVSGMAVKVLFDHTTDDQVLVLGGDKCFDFRKSGGLRDPESAGGTGDILFTTAGHTANDSYTIDMTIGLQ
jgi:hypothetical protein